MELDRRGFIADPAAAAVIGGVAVGSVAVGGVAVAQVPRGSLALPAVKAAIAKARPLIAAMDNSHVTRPVGGHGLK